MSRTMTKLWAAPQTYTYEPHLSIHKSIISSITRTVDHSRRDYRKPDVLWYPFFCQRRMSMGLHNNPGPRAHVYIPQQIIDPASNTQEKLYFRRVQLQGQPSAGWPGVGPTRNSARENCYVFTASRQQRWPCVNLTTVTQRTSYQYPHVRTLSAMASTFICAARSGVSYSLGVHQSKQLGPRVLINIASREREWRNIHFRRTRLYHQPLQLAPSHVFCRLPLILPTHVSSRMLYLGLTSIVCDCPPCFLLYYGPPYYLCSDFGWFSGSKCMLMSVMWSWLKVKDSYLILSMRTTWFSLSRPCPLVIPLHFRSQRHNSETYRRPSPVLSIH
ncbi:hypothetical protein BKA70DRAFT_1353379 [Coprinopsis sp. MPI-PUGE-AT-0042]|nr:hypothetical protein BKA70DRAFT_1353379 [Coprinopsis sp. MPI-PUGE-AT-0042]